MGKKGKVDAKRAKVAYRNQRKKEAKESRRLQWKLRRPQNHELRCVQDGIEEAIREQGAEPGPVTFFACLLSVLQGRPDPKKLPYFLALVDMNVPHLPDGLLRKYTVPLVDTLNQLLRQHGGDPLVVRKGMGLVRTLYTTVEPSAATLQRLGLFEPNKLHAQYMEMYMKTLQQVFLHIFREAPTLVYDGLVPLVRGGVANFFDAQECVSRATAACLKAVLGRAVTRAFVALHKDKLDGVVAELHRALREVQYRQCWDLICDCLAAVASRLALLRSALSGADELACLRDVVVTADRLRALDDFHFNSSAEACVGAVARCVPCNALLKLLPLDVEDKDPIRGRHYLLAVLRRNVAHDSLGYFVKTFAPLTVRCKRQADQCLLQGEHVEAKTMRVLQQQTWDLLPGFATYPCDLAEGTTYRTLAREMTGHFNSAELCRIVCRTFVLLVEKNKALSEAQTRVEMLKQAADAAKEEAEGADSDAEEGEEDEEDDGKSAQGGDDDEGDDEEDEEGADRDDVESLDPVEEIEAVMPSLMDAGFHDCPREEEDPHAFHGLPRDVAKANVAHMAGMARNILPLLCNAIESGESEDRRTLLLAVLRSYSSISPPEVINAIFRQVHTTLSDAAPVAEGEEGARRMKNQTMMDIGCVLGEYLDEGALGILIDLIEPLLVDPSDDALLQKKSYKALARICKTRKDIVERQLTRITAMLAKAAEHCAAGSRRERLQCLGYVAMAHGSNPGRMRAYVATILTEVLLGVKEASTRTREMAFFCLQLLGQLLDPARKEEGAAPDVTPLCKLVLAGLGGTTPLLVSCSVICLSRLLHESGQSVDPALVDSIVKSCVLLIQHRSNEIKNAAMGFVKLALRGAARWPALKELLERYFDVMVKGCLAWTQQARVPGATRRTVRLIIERSIRRFGVEWVRGRFPEEHKRYVDYVQREWQREQRKRQRERDEARADRDRLRALKAGGAAPGQRLRMRADEGELDLMDAGDVGHLVAEGQRTLLDTPNTGKRDGFNVAIGGDGGVVVETEEEHKRRGRQRMLEQRLAEMKGAGRHGLEELSGGLLARRKRRRDDDAPDDGDNDKALMQEQQHVQDELKLLAQALKKKPQQTQGSRLTDMKKKPRADADVRSGAQYKGGGRTGGDIKKGGLDPHAYVPLNAKFLNKRHRMKVGTRLASVAGKVLKGGKAGGKKKRRGNMSAVQSRAFDIARREARDAKLKGRGGKAARKGRR